MGDIQVGDRVRWRKRWLGQDEDETMVGTVIELGASTFGPHAWISVKNDQSPQFANLSKLTRVDTPVVPASSLEVLCDDYDDMLRWSGSLGTVEL